jgi:acyl-CoA dehydrogenase
MSWDFTTDPEFQAKLDWADRFVTEECEPLDLAFPDQERMPPHPALRGVILPLSGRVREQGLWAAHLGPDRGGGGYGQLSLALLNEVLGRSQWAPVIFGTQAPDSGNAEILARYGTPEQQAAYLEPLLSGEIFSCYSMTEPHAGADPKQFTMSARRDGGGWILDGEKYFASNSSDAAFLIVLAVTNQGEDPYRRLSSFLVPTATPGLSIIHNVDTLGTPYGSGRPGLRHGHLRFAAVRLPADALLGGEGQGFEVAQTRLGAGRLHHAMRTVAVCKLALDMTCRRALSRQAQGSRVADKQLVQEAIADSWREITQFRLMVLYTAWLCDQSSTAGARREIAACKVQAAKLMVDVLHRAIHVHGALGASNETPLAALWARAPQMGIMDGPTEVHQITVARQTLREYQAYEGVFPPYWLPPRIAAAQARYRDVLDAIEAHPERGHTGVAVRPAAGGEQAW